MISSKMTCRFIFMILIVALFGCGTTSTLVGKNRYQISSHGLKADAAFAQKAKEQCPKGFKVIERSSSFDMSIPGLVGTIECE